MANKFKPFHGLQHLLSSLSTLYNNQIAIWLSASPSQLAIVPPLSPSSRLHLLHFPVLSCLYCCLLVSTLASSPSCLHLGQFTVDQARTRQDSSAYDQCHEIMGEVSLDWDCSLYLPLWVYETEKASIEERLKGWTKRLKESGADIASLSACLKKPLRPLWIS